MLLEVLILGGDDRILKHFRDLFVGKKNAALQREGADGLAVVGVKLGDRIRAVVFERVNFGKVARVNEQQAGARAECNRQEEQKSERQPAEKRADGDPHRVLNRLVHGKDILSHGQISEWNSRAKCGATKQH
jgi:hypothetical protein